MKFTVKNAVFFQTGTEIERIILFLHGYGANGEDLLDIGKNWEKSLSNTLFIAPDAPYIHPQLSSGYMWFDFKDTSNITVDDIKNGLDKIRPVIKDYLQTLSKTYSVPISRIIPVGFSQGAMIALDLLVCEPEVQAVIDYAGVYYPTRNSIENPEFKKALLVHGADDTVVPYRHMAEAEILLTHLGIHVTCLSCEGLGHSINPEGIAAGEAFLKEV